MYLYKTSRSAIQFNRFAYGFPWLSSIHVGLDLEGALSLQIMQLSDVLKDFSDVGGWL